MNSVAPAAAGPVPAPARFFDGRSARAHLVQVWFLPGPELVIRGSGFEQRHPAARINLDRALGDAPRFLQLPGDQTCEFTDGRALDAALAGWPVSTGPHPLGWRFYAGTLLGLMLAVWLAISQGLPLAARAVAFMLPADTMERVSRGTLAELDREIFEPSRLPPERREALLREARSFLGAAGESPDRRIEFRSAPEIGPNAMALPSGDIIVTDDIVLLARNDEQLLAVLAHECGHLHYRHALRGILQDSAVTMMVTLVAGKQSSANSLQSELTATLIHLRYSRDFEYEADAYGAQLLRRVNIPPARLGEMLDLLEQQAGGRSRGALDSYLSSHPSTPERKERLKKQ